MPARSDIVNEARRWLGTPFHHQGRQLGVGVDCVGVLFGVAWALGISDFDHRAYHRRPNTDEMGALLRGHLDAIAVADADAGDVLRFNIEQRPQHLGILTGHNTILHAFQTVGRCVEHRMDARWWRRVVSAHRFPGVTL